MNPYEILGITLVILSFVALFSWQVHQDGWVSALAAWALTVLVIAVLAAGCWCLSEGLLR